jgi:indolepyruvate ferredoxin oxidoreductase
VLSFVRFAATDALLNQVRIDTQQADLLLACDMVVGASADALQTVRHDRTRIVVNTHEIPNASFVQNPEANLHADALLAKMRHAATAGHADAQDPLSTCDAQALAQRYLGDTIGANIVMLGFAWQLGLVPVSLAALTRAIELNNVAVQANLFAFAIGRMAAADPAALEALDVQRAAAAKATSRKLSQTLDERVADREARLLAYGGAAYVKRYRALVDAARGADRSMEQVVSRAVASTFYTLLAVKDEYEVARLHADPAFRAALEAQFEGKAGSDFTVKFNLAPPLIAREKNGQPPRKMQFGQWLWSALALLSKGRGVRGTWFDPFARTLERRMERALADDYKTTLRHALATLSADNTDEIAKLASLHQRVRGYGHVKLANLAAVKRSERELGARLKLDVKTSAVVQEAIDSFKGAGALRGIPVVVTK